MDLGWIKQSHVLLAYVTALGFVARAALSFVGSDLLGKKLLKIAPHVIDTLLLVLGIWLAVALHHAVLSGWLAAKLVGLIAYIGFGVLTLRGTGALKMVGLLGALLSLAYIFSVAFTRNPWPL